MPHEVFDERERDTIIAALRFYQAALAEDPDNIPTEIQVIAENERSGKDAALSAEEIDDLCERINR